MDEDGYFDVYEDEPDEFAQALGFDSQRQYLDSCDQNDAEAAEED